MEASHLNVWLMQCDTAIHCSTATKVAYTTAVASSTLATCTACHSTSTGTGTNTQQHNMRKTNDSACHAVRLPITVHCARKVLVQVMQHRGGRLSLPCCCRILSALTCINGCILALPDRCLLLSLFACCTLLLLLPLIQSRLELQAQAVATHISQTGCHKQSAARQLAESAASRCSWQLH